MVARCFAIAVKLQIADFGTKGNTMSLELFAKSSKVRRGTEVLYVVDVTKEAITSHCISPPYHIESRLLQENSSALFDATYWTLCNPVSLRQVWRRSISKILKLLECCLELLGVVGINYARFLSRSEVPLESLSDFRC